MRAHCFFAFRMQVRSRHSQSSVILCRHLTGASAAGTSGAAAATNGANSTKSFLQRVLPVGVTSGSLLVACGLAVVYEVNIRRKLDEDVDEVAEVLKPMPDVKRGGAPPTSSSSGEAASDEDSDIGVGFLDRRGVKHINLVDLLHRVFVLGGIFLPVVALWFPWWYLSPCVVEYIQDPSERKLIYDEQTGKVEIVDEGISPLSGGAGGAPVLPGTGNAAHDSPPSIGAPNAKTPNADPNPIAAETTSGTETGYGTAGFPTSTTSAAPAGGPRLRQQTSTISAISKAKEKGAITEEELQENQQRRLRWCKVLRHALEQAGPVFIKWGQWASTRYDLFPIELCDELNRLTQNSPAHSMADTEEILTRNFGPDVLEFLKLEPEPVASGSIGQVYRARVHVGAWRAKEMRKGLKNAGYDVVGAEGGAAGSGTADPNNYVVNVAVKVQHPRLERVMDLDFAILETLSRFTDSICSWYRRS
eukprot:g11601.t1